MLFHSPNLFNGNRYIIPPLGMDLANLEMPIGPVVIHLKQGNLIHGVSGKLKGSELDESWV